MASNPNDLTATYDFAATPMIADVRFEILDVDVYSSPPDQNPTERTQWSCNFTDAEIQRKIDLHPDDTVNQAAADLLMIVASNDSMLARLITLGEYTSDTRQLPDKVRAQAAALRTKTADTAAALAAAGDTTAAEAITEENWNIFSTRRLWWAELTR